MFTIFCLAEIIISNIFFIFRIPSHSSPLLFYKCDIFSSIMAKYNVFGFVPIFWPLKLDSILQTDFVHFTKQNWDQWFELLHIRINWQVFSKCTIPTFHLSVLFIPNPNRSIGISRKRDFRNKTPTPMLLTCFLIPHQNQQTDMNTTEK